MTPRVHRGNRIHFLLCLLIVMGMVSVASQAQAEVVIIGNKSLAVESVTLKQAKKLWLKKSLKLPGTGKVKLVDQFKANATYTEFYRKIVKKKPSQLKAYWAKVTFTGKAFPPEQMADDASVIDWVANTSNAMGYVDGSAVNDSVKRLLTVK